MKEKYWSHQGVIWQLVGGPGFRQRASCAQQMALFCPRFPPLMTQRTLTKPFYKSTKAVLHQNQMFPLKNPLSQLFVEKLVLGRQIFLLEGEIVLFKAWKLKLV